LTALLELESAIPPPNRDYNWQRSGGPVHTAANVAKSTAETGKNVAHSVVKGTRRAGHTVAYAFTR